MTTSTNPTQQRISELSRLLRAVGALVVLAAASTFLLQRWSMGDDVHRAWTLLAHTALLAVAGFACGIALREDKGARTFLASRKTAGHGRAALELATLGGLGLACSSYALALELPEAAFLPIVALSFAPAAAALSLSVTEMGATYRRVAASAAIVGMGSNVLLFPGPLTSWLCVATSVAVIAYASFVQQRMILLAGALGLLLGLSQQLHYAVDLFHRSQWIALAVLGSVTILGASLLERHHERLGARLRAVRAELSSWDV